MSAQLITALRRRADTLEAEAADIGCNGEKPAQFPTASRSYTLVKALAAEFRALADEAERTAP